MIPSTALRQHPLAQRHLRRARNLYHGESVPADSGMAVYPLEASLVWVWDNCGDIEVVLVAAANHGLVIPIRLWSCSKDSMAVRKVLDKFLKDCYARGYRFAAMCLDPEAPVEQRLLRIAGRLGAQVVGKGVVVAGGINPEGRVAAAAEEG